MKRNLKRKIASRALPKAPSGIYGLDEITGGGLPRGRPTLVCGGAGCGKTLLATEFLVRAAMQYNESGPPGPRRKSNERDLSNRTHFHPAGGRPPRHPRSNAHLAARDIKSALRVGHKTEFDLLICDVQLPDGDGRKLLEKLSADRELVGIAMSGHCAPTDLARSKAAGFVRHLIKPFKIEELESVLAAAKEELVRRNASKAPAAIPKVTPNTVSNQARQ